MSKPSFIALNIEHSVRSVFLNVSHITSVLETDDERTEVTTVTGDRYYVMPLSNEVMDLIDRVLDENS